MAARGDRDDQRTPEEIARIRDEGLKRLLRMPPKQHKDMKLGKPRGRMPPEVVADDSHPPDGPPG